MKKLFKVITIIVLSISLTNCATLLGGPVTEHQKSKPGPSEPARQIRVVSLLAGIVFLPSLVVDFATKAIYKPNKNKKLNKNL